MHKLLLMSLLLLSASQSALAASVTARITANVLGPANIAFPAAGKLDSARTLAINSTRDLHYELSHRRQEQCRIATEDGASATLASCDTYTINFN